MGAAVVDTKTALRPLVIEHGFPLPSNRAPEQFRLARVRPIGAAPASANEFAADWELEDFLRGTGIEILDYEAVCQKMLRLAEAQRARWGWYRLRQQDCGSFADWLHTRAGKYERERGGALTHGRLVDAVYPLAVPQLAWELVSWIERGFGQRINFYVTHYEDRQPDPFLAATVNGRELYVIAEWKQPGRREPLRGNRNADRAQARLVSRVMAALFHVLVWRS